MKKAVEIIKANAKYYNDYYPYVFRINVTKTQEFKSFIYHSSTNIVEVLSSFNIENPVQVFSLLYDKFEERVLGNDTGFSVLKHLFYIALIFSISKKTESAKETELVVHVEDKKAFSLFLERAKEMNEFEAWHKWYRGQSNFEWDLIPSFFRGINKKKLVQVDQKYIWQEYNDFGLIDKAYKTIGYSNVDYNFLSFMQHAVSFSPLIDFTSNPIVATVMGLSDTDNFREHYSNDSALFELGIDEKQVITKREDVDNVINSYCVYYSQTFPFGNTVNLHGRTISIIDIKSLIDALTPQYLLIDIPTNDRMRYQSGKFVLFYDCLIVGKKIYVELAKGMNFTRYKLNKNLKQKKEGEPFLDSLLKEYPEFSVTNMMNPYEWFGR